MYSVVSFYSKNCCLLRKDLFSEKWSSNIKEILLWEKKERKTFFWSIIISCFSCRYRKKNKTELNKGEDFFGKEIEKNKSHHKCLLSVSLQVFFFLLAVAAYFFAKTLRLFFYITCFRFFSASLLVPALFLLQCWTIHGKAL